MYERVHDDLPAPPDYDIPVVTTTDTQVYDLPVATTDISMNTNPAYTTTRFGEAQRPDSSHTYVNVMCDSDYM